jgi:hypothetical protein
MDMKIGRPQRIANGLCRAIEQAAHIGRSGRAGQENFFALHGGQRFGHRFGGPVSKGLAEGGDRLVAEVEWRPSSRFLYCASRGRS